MKLFAPYSGWCASLRLDDRVRPAAAPLSQAVTLSGDMTKTKILLYQIIIFGTSI
jgi:hypothetical protein